MDGYIYFLTNISMPGMIKVGFTTGQVEERAVQLGGTGVPTPFTIGAQFYVTNPNEIEKKVHDTLKGLRVNDQREFFQGELSEILKICFPIIVEAIPDQIGGAEELPQPVPLLSEISTQIILSLIPDREFGRSMREFEDDRNLPSNPLIIEKELETLRNDGYVEFRKVRRDRWIPPTVYWSITSKGIKMLFDTGLLKEEDDLEKYTQRW